MTITISDDHVVGVLAWCVGGQTKLVHLVVCRLKSLLFRLDLRVTYLLRIVRLAVLHACENKRVNSHEETQMQ